MHYANNTQGDRRSQHFRWSNVTYWFNLYIGTCGGVSTGCTCVFADDIERCITRCQKRPLYPFAGCEKKNCTSSGKKKRHVTLVLLQKTAASTLARALRSGTPASPAVRRSAVSSSSRRTRTMHPPIVPRNREHAACKSTHTDTIGHGGGRNQNKAR